jgi:GNAT superfamily N-acetyltransferase
MSYHRRKRRKQQHVPQQQPALPTLTQAEVEPAEMPEPMNDPVETPEQPPVAPPMPSADSPTTIRYATPDDVQRIHFFLCLVSGPVLLAPINAAKAWMEIARILESKTEFALIAEVDGELVGTLGIIAPDWWYSDEKFMTDRWFFVYPQLAWKGVGMALMAEAALIAQSVGLPLIINGKPVRKNKQTGGGLHFMSHKLVTPAPVRVH